MTPEEMVKNPGLATPFDLAQVAEVWLAGQPIQVVRIRRIDTDGEGNSCWLVTPDDPALQHQARWLSEADGYEIA